MIKEAVLSLLTILSLLTGINSADYNYIEIFDISKGDVIKVVESNPKIQKAAINYLQDITGVYSKFNPIPKKGHAIRIPLKSPVTVQNSFLNSVVREVIVMYPQDEGSKAFLMILEDDGKLMCFTFKGNIHTLLKLLDFEHCNKK